MKSWLALPGVEARACEQALPASIRRRVTPLGRRALAAAWSLSPGPDTRFIFASRHGEYARTFSMLQSLAKEAAVSPADFSMSVHHALAGLLSIATGSRQGHAALAAGGDTFGYALVEAAACLADGSARSVLAVYYDEPLPPPYREVDRADEAPTVVALALENPGGGGETFEIAAGPRQDGEPEDLASRFAAFLGSQDVAGSARGERLHWRWAHVQA